VEFVRKSIWYVP